MLCPPGLKSVNVSLAKIPKGWFSVGVGVIIRGVERYDLMKIKQRSHKQSRKGYGIGTARIRTFPFASDSVYDSVSYDLVKTRLSQPHFNENSFISRLSRHTTRHCWYEVAE